MGGGRSRLSHAFTVTEVALALVLLIGAGLLIQSFLRLQSVDPGFKTAQLLTVEVDMAAVSYPDQAAGSSSFASCWSACAECLVSRPLAACR